MRNTIRVMLVGIVGVLAYVLLFFAANWLWNKALEMEGPGNLAFFFPLSLLTLPWLPFLWLLWSWKYRRLEADRHRLVKVVKANPGVTPRELAEQLGHRLDYVHRLIDRSGGEEWNLVEADRQRLVNVVKANPGVTPRELAEQLGHRLSYIELLIRLSGPDIETTGTTPGVRYYPSRTRPSSSREE